MKLKIMQLELKKDYDDGQIMETWGPIMVEFDMPEENIEFACKYAHFHSIHEISTSTTIDDKFPKVGSTLPMAIKLIKELKNLDTVLYKFTSDVDTQQKSFELTHELINEFSMSELYQHLANRLIRKIAGDINAKILADRSANFTIFNVGVLVNSITTVTEGTMSPKLVMTSRYKFRSIK